MDTGQKTKYSEKAVAGKYCGLYERLAGLQSREWETSFREIESIVGFDLPESARLYRAWWANERSDSRHSQSIAWTAAGWETADVDMDAETLSFRRRGVFGDDSPGQDLARPPDQGMDGRAYPQPRGNLRR